MHVILFNAGNHFSLKNILVQRCETKVRVDLMTFYTNKYSQTSSFFVKPQELVFFHIIVFVKPVS